MKRGCAVALFTWAVCGGAYWYFLHERFRAPLDWLVPLIAGLLMAGAIGSLRMSIASGRDALKVSSQDTLTGFTGEKLKDGANVSVVGRIRAAGLQLQAPFSGRAAVMYRYQIDDTVGFAGEDQEWKDFSGLAQAPAVIDSSYGAIKLLGFPILEGFDSSLQNSSESRAKAAAYIAATPFVNIKSLGLREAMREVFDTAESADGKVRKDWRSATSDDLSDKDDKDILEQIVAPGEQVCAVGKYSAEKNGLVPDLSLDRRLRLIRGNAAVAADSLGRRTAVGLARTVIMIAIVNGALFLVLRSHDAKTPIGVPRTAQTLRENMYSLHASARGGDLQTVQRLVGEGTPVDARDEERRTPLAQASDATMAAWLIAHGADVNAANENGETVLMEQADLGHADVVRLLVTSGAKLDAVSSKWKSTALQRALDAEHLDVAQILRDAGAHDDTITAANGRALAADSKPVRAAIAYLAAVQKEDRAELVRLSTFPNFNDVDFKIWKASRPMSPTLVEAYANEGNATVMLRGPNPRGVNTTWTYQLIRRGEEWKVSGE
ncbi:MAG: ankyrin repeat domain-containing protein, partial [Thermoanaerobaculia bacterium]